MPKIRRTGYYRRGQPKLGSMLSADTFGIRGMTTTEVAQAMRGEITQQAVNQIQVKVVDKIRFALMPLIRDDAFSVRNPDHARQFVTALEQASAEAEENDKLSDLVVVRARQIMALTGCTDERAVKQAIRELLDPTHD